VHLRAEGDRIFDREAWIQRGERILEHHLHLAAHVAECEAVLSADGEAVEQQLALVGLDQADQQPRGRGLAAARLADDAERLALGDGEVHAVDRLHRREGAVEHAAAHREVLDQAAHREQRLRRPPTR